MKMEIWTILAIVFASDPPYAIRRATSLWICPSLSECR